jgi:pyruvate/2-oxoglutarate dehydrogenase complex dihydrolipoamide acyltransferase (E2) component
VDRVVAAEGKAVVRPMMTLTLSCDHRVVDGAHAAMFLKDLSGSLEQIEEFLVLEDSFSSEIRPGEIPD